MKSSLPKIGIVGGAGPMAGLLLCQKIIQFCQETYGCRDDADFPYLMLLSYPFADMLAAEQSPAQRNIIRKQLDECFETFSSLGITCGAIACNTLHAYLDGEAPFTFVHIMEETSRKLAEKKVERSLVLCSSTSVKSLIHQDYFNCCYPPAEWQERVDDLITTILAGRETVQDVDRLIGEIQTFCASQSMKGGEPFGIVLGCTEFSVINGKWPLSVYGLREQWSVIDSTQALAEGLCRLIFNNTNQLRS